MPREFKPRSGPWQRYAPARVQAQLNFPGGFDLEQRGRVELVIGRLGAGKTTWAALRATRLARVTGRTLATTGLGWPEPWVQIDSYDKLHDLRDAVLVWDEVHVMMPSARGMLSAEAERFLVRETSMFRKRDIDVIGATQAWTRPSTAYRQLVTTVWVAQPVIRSKRHHATAYDRPDDGGEQQLEGRQWFSPRAANIPTKAEVWFGYDPVTGEEQAIPRSIGGAGRASARAAADPVTLLPPPAPLVLRTLPATAATSARKVSDPGVMSQGHSTDGDRPSDGINGTG